MYPVVCIHPPVFTLYFPRKIRVLEERVLPDLNHQIKTIYQYIDEREREAYYRLKMFKNISATRYG